MPTINVKDAPFNAVGDGVADDTQAVVQAVAAARAASITEGTAAGARGVTVFFPGGQYRVAEALHFDYTHGIRLLGEGTTGGIGSSQSATLRFTQPAPPGVNLISAVASGNFQIEHLDIQYDNAGMLGTLVAVDGGFFDRPYNFGTVAVARGSSVVTLSGTAPTDPANPAGPQQPAAWIPTAPAMRLIRIGARLYRITITSPTDGELDTPYEDADDGNALYDLLTGNDTTDPAFRNVHFGGPPDGTGHAKCLLSLNMTIGAVVDKCLLNYADSGIVGQRYGGWGSFTATIANSTFMRLGSGAGIRDAGGVWLIESCTFEPAYGYDDGPVGILHGTKAEEGAASWILNVNNCWFGDGGGQNLRPWVRFNGFILNFTNNHVASAGPRQPLIVVGDDGSTVHNVNISGNYLAPHQDNPGPMDLPRPEDNAPAIATANSTIESMTISGNWWGYGSKLLQGACKVQNLTIIDTGARTDFRTGFYEYSRTTAKSGVATGQAIVAGRFAAPAGTWTVVGDGPNAVRYALAGLTLTLWFDLGATVVSNDPDYLQIELPEGLSAAFSCTAGQFEYRDAGGASSIGSTFASGTALRLYKLGKEKWSPVLDQGDPAQLTTLRGVAVLPVNEIQVPD